MKALIIEDEKPAADRLNQLILNSTFDIKVVQVLDSIKSSVSWLKNNELPDLVFLDIHLSDGPSFEILRLIQVDIPIIFITAYDEYALEAFQHNCIDYLLKPVDQRKLNKSLQKMDQWMRMGNQKLLELLEKNLHNKPSPVKYKDRFLVKGKDKLISIKSEQIAYFMSVNKATILITHENRSFAIDYTLEELEKLLDPEHFFRLNRGIFAHQQSIRNIENYFNGKLKVTLMPEQKDKPTISRDKAKAFKIWMGE